LAKKESEKSRQQLIIGVTIIGLIGTIGFLLFIFNRLKVTRRQKKQIQVFSEELGKVHEELKIQHSEIQDSIHYAERIQKAIMPAESVMCDVLGEAFILYLPKDVVAGDFYWMESKVLPDTIFFAAADCTGHGVPGALVSVVCSNALSRAVVEEQIYETGPLLDRTRDIVTYKLAKGGYEVKDGMDISLCKLNTKTGTLQWSGANNPIWIVRNNMVFEEIKADKQPVGKYEHSNPFQSHEIELNKGDTIYLMSDGYQDQFGGPKNKKYKSKRLKSFLIELFNKPMPDQKQALIKEFNQWKEGFEQIDDVCLVGLRIG
jgi:serine phosphatase RsbU (regulator of sigma subunit)